ncbi:MAG: hypothetical protein LUF87_03325 [Alistipes sp.]|nr:hypothetical protein [Alistipes sp.]
MKTNKRFIAVSSVAVLAVLLVAGLFVWNGHRPATIYIDGDGVHITGIYGGVTGFGEIASVEVADAIPAVRIRTKGYSFCGTHKGYFTVDGWGRTLLFTHSASTGPYLVLTDADGRRTAFKTTGEEQARELCQAIQEKRVCFTNVRNDVAKKI